jgi:hypothetical protein
VDSLSLLQSKMAKRLPVAFGEEVAHVGVCEVFAVRGARLALRRCRASRPGRGFRLVVEDREGEGHGGVDVLGARLPHRKAFRLGRTERSEPLSPMHLLLREREAVPGLEHLRVRWNNDVVIEEAGVDPHACPFGIEIPIEVGALPLPQAVILERDPGVAAAHLVLLEGGDEPAHALAVADRLRADLPLLFGPVELERHALQ